MSKGVHPQIQAVLETMQAQALPNPAECTVAQARELAELAGARRQEAFGPIELARVEDLASPGGIPVRIYRPLVGQVLPVLVYYHGGGHVICSLETHDLICRNLAQLTECAVVSVDYAMGPEHPFPAAVDTSYAATRWISQSAEELGFDPTRLAVGGDSAGGNLAAVVALMARDLAEFGVSAQVLVYPVIDYRGGTASYSAFGTGYGILEERTVAWFADHYFADPGDMEDWRAAPHLAERHTGLPPTFVLTAECDVLHDEGAAYAQQLRKAGVSVDYETYPGMIHAFFGFLGLVDDTQRAHRRVAAFLKDVWR
ncbi:MAG: alpha/beta hydrolase [Paracoccaceae bacterium]